MLLLASGAEAATRFVDNSCTNNGDGTTTTCASGAGQPGPFKTIGAAVAVAVAGDVIRVKRQAADYIENVTTAAAGTASNPITLTCYVGDTVKPTWKRSSGTQFTINHAYWVIDSLEFFGSDINSAQIRVRAANITFQHCLIRRNIGHGFSLAGNTGAGITANNFTIQWCTLDSLGAGGDRHALTTGHAGEDSFAYSVQNIKILNNTFRNGGADLIQFFEDEIGTPCRSAHVSGLIQFNAFIRGSRDPLVENAIDIKAAAWVDQPMYITDNTFYGWDGIGGIVTTANAGKTITTQHCAEYTKVERNIFDKGNGVGACNPCMGIDFQADNTGAGPNVRGNRIVQNTFVGFRYSTRLASSGHLDSLYVYNNTSDSLFAAAEAFMRIEGPINKLICRNNLTKGIVLNCSSGANISGVVADHNGWFGTGVNCDESPCTAPSDVCDAATDKTGTNPGWIDPASGNYNLAASSTAIDAGVNVGLPFNGSAPDMGAKESGSTNNAPVLTQPSAMVVNEGSTADQTITATDADGDPLTFSKLSGPAYATVTTTSPGTGTGTGNIHLAPGFSDAGGNSMVARASDGVAVSDKTVTLTVNNVNTAPTLTQPSNMTVDENVTADQALNGSDPEGDALTFTKVSGPAYMTVTTTTSTTGNIHLAPSYTDAEVTTGTVRASDGTLTNDKSFSITVNNVNRAPTLTQPANMSMSEGAVVDQTISATDPDNDALTFSKVSGGGTFTTVTTVNSTTGNIHCAPVGGDAAGSPYSVVVRASDGTLNSDKTLTVTVTAVPPFIDACTPF
jgi:hypothetical protein